jgi:tetraacyldisaccharide 4'-kinase
MHRLDHYWYQISPLHLLLWPLSMLFALLTTLRRALYRIGILRTTRLPVPVVVVGNISVGGTGKTPLVIWLARRLRESGFVPGIVSRGYGGSAILPQQITNHSDPRLAGDEAVLLARRAGCPVWIGANRAAAANALLAAHVQCNVVISDDGLQHYALARDVEIVVIDGDRGFGNEMLLPAGPLREGRWRLDGISALVINGTATFPREILPAGIPAFDMTLAGKIFINLLNPQLTVGPEYFLDRNVHAIAAIGSPQRFFRQLRDLGISFTAHPFPDHYAFDANDFAFNHGDTVIMTEKDAVKCDGFCTENFWALPVDADMDIAFGTLIADKMRR